MLALSEPAEIAAVTVIGAAVLGVVIRGIPMIDRWHTRRLGRWLSLERIARWFPDEHPNGEESLPAQVEALKNAMKDHARQMGLHVIEDRESFAEVKERLSAVERTRRY